MTQVAIILQHIQQIVIKIKKQQNNHLQSKHLTFT